MAYTALQVKEKLEAYGVNATVLDPVFVKPLDSELLCTLLLTHQRIVTIEEHSVVSGMGSIINNFLMSQGYSHLQVINIGVPETFVEQGSHAELVDELGLTPTKIVQRIAVEFNLAEKNAFALSKSK
jgi:1-deoxy-D-xylulose-5-phosphate synthase